MPSVDEVVQEVDNVEAELEQTLERCSEADLNLRTEAEGWAVGVVARHIGLGFRQARVWLETLDHGEPVTTTIDEIHQRNEANREVESPSRTELLEFLGAARARLDETLSSIGDEGFSRKGYFGVTQSDRTVGEVAAVAPRHARGHLNSIEATLSKNGA